MIYVLDHQTANGIAAGEVVERPASVMKELTENALDAGATAVRCEIEQGGIRLIRVSDNGCGMSPEDAQKSFLRHATSKLRTLEDLEHLHSMGFRGEALASIAAVSRVTMVTKEKNAPEGFKLRIEAGEVLETALCGAPDGTTLEVRDLFFNTPARFKFLKRDSTEAAYVQDLLERLAFTRPDVSFRLLKDGKEVVLTPGNNDLLSVIYTVWGRESAEAALALQGAADHIACSGYISSSSKSRKNRGRQIYMVNKRVIQSPLIRAAVDQACQGHFVKGQFPEMVLCIELPTHMVDVNVHPQKSEVRFADEQEVFRAVYHSIKNTLEAGTGIRKIEESSPALQGISLERPAEREQMKLDLKVQSSSASAGPSSNTALQREHRFERLDTAEQAFAFPKLEAGEKPAEAHRNLLAEEQPENPKESLQVSPASDNHGYTSPKDEEALHFGEEPVCHEQDEAARDSVKRLLQSRLIGQVFNTYLLLEEGDDLLLIDQHAAHERILYEKLLKRREESLQQSIPSQVLLTPIAVEVSAVEMAQVMEKEKKVRELGFEFEVFSDNSLLLRSVPQTPGGLQMDPEKSFRTLIEYCGSAKMEFDDPVEELFHTMACKAAVKAHDILSYDEMKALLLQLQDLKDPYHCPHGRPVIIRLSRQEIEKMFKRIV